MVITKEGVRLLPAFLDAGASTPDRSHAGAWERYKNLLRKLHGMVEPLAGNQLYSLRVTGSARAISCLLAGPTIVLVCLHSQHDKAYRK